jgi:hypothetical protein
MSRLFELALALLRGRPPEPREEDAREMLGRGKRGGQDGLGKAGEIDPKYLPDVLEGVAQAQRHQFAPDVQMEANLRRFEE